MYQETRKIAQDNRMPGTSIAEMAEVPSSDVSEFFNGKYVTRQNAVKIEQAVADIVELLNFMSEHFGLRPDLKDVPSLREAINGLKNARRFVELRKETEATIVKLFSG